MFSVSPESLSQYGDRSRQKISNETSGGASPIRRGLPQWSLGCGVALTLYKGTNFVRTVMRLSDATPSHLGSAVFPHRLRRWKPHR